MTKGEYPLGVKEYLSEIKILDKIIKDKQGELQELFCIATSITAPTDRDPVQSTGQHSDKVVNGVLMIAEKQEEISRLIAEREKRIKLIRCLKKPIEYDVIYGHYVLGLSLADLAEELHYTYQYIILIHGRALKKLNIQCKFNVNSM